MNGTVSSSIKLCFGVSGSGHAVNLFNTVTQLTLTSKSSYLTVKQFAQDFTRDTQIPECALSPLNIVP